MSKCIVPNDLPLAKAPSKAARLRELDRRLKLLIDRGLADNEMRLRAIHWWKKGASIDIDERGAITMTFSP